MQCRRDREMVSSFPENNAPLFFFFFEEWKVKKIGAKMKF